MAQIKSFAKNVIFEQNKKLIMAITGIIYTYIIANYLGPADYGLVIYFTAFMVLLNFFGVSVIQSLIRVFIPKCKSKDLFFKILKWQYIIVLPVVAAVFFFAPVITEFIGKDFPFLLRWSAILALFTPLYTSLIYLFRGFKLFGKAVKIESVMQIVVLLASILFVIVMGFGMVGVIYAQLFATIVCIILGIYYFRKIPFSNLTLESSEIKKFVKFRYPTAFIESGYQQFIILMMGIFITPAVLGYFYLAEKIYGLFIGKTATTLGDVLHPYLMEKYKEKDVLGRFVSLGIKANFIVNSFFMIVMVITTQFLLTIFMPDFVPAGIIVLGFGLIALMHPVEMMNHIFVSINRMDLAFKERVITTIMKIVGVLLLMPWFTVTALIWAPAFNLWSEFVIFRKYSNFLNIKVQIIPRRKDISFFWSIIKRGFKKYVVR
ncbi:MAG: oligosaccharide flippase family protein [Candidatus Diapherotrites archaeon]